MEGSPLTSSEVRNTTSEQLTRAYALCRSHALSEILDQGAFPRTINVQELRQICSRG